MWQAYFWYNWLRNTQGQANSSISTSLSSEPWAAGGVRDAQHRHRLRFGLCSCSDRARGRTIQNLPSLLPWAVSLEEDGCLHLLFPFICLYLFLKATQGVGLVGSSGKMNHLAVSDARTPGLLALRRALRDKRMSRHTQEPRISQREFPRHHSVPLV